MIGFPSIAPVAIMFALHYVTTELVAGWQAVAPPNATVWSACSWGVDQVGHPWPNPVLQLATNVDYRHRNLSVLPGRLVG